MPEHANPSGCRHCGIDKHGHLSQWAPHPVGWHTWVEPTMEQRKAAIKANLGRFTGKRLDRTEQEPKPEPAGFCCGCCDDEPEPDWADLREMARNAGWRFERTPKDLPFRDRILWDVVGPATAPGRRAACITNEDTGIEVNVWGQHGEVIMQRPSPARVLAAARLVGLGGAS